MTIARNRQTLQWLMNRPNRKRLARIIEKPNINQT
jgi:hypothetical protein